jgi:putative ABC transport system permease protein
MRVLHYWRRHVRVASAVICTIAVGIGAATAVYAVVEAVIVRALPVRDPGQLVWMWNARVERDRAPFSALDLLDYQNQNAVLEGLAAFTNWTGNLTGGEDAERLDGIRIDPAFLRLVGVEPALGRSFIDTDRRAQVVILTDRLWRRRFGRDSAIVGRSVSLNGIAHTVVGILPAGFVFPFRDAEIAVPLSIEGDPRRSDRGAGFLRVVARLKPGVSLTSAKANLDAIGARLRQEYPTTNGKKVGVNLYPLSHEIVGDARVLLLTLLGAVGLLLLVACANMTNLLLAALTSRRRELSLRVALGATRWRIGRELLGEIGILVAAGGLAGLLLGRDLARVLVWWGGTALPRFDDVSVTPTVAAFAIGLTVAAGLVCGVIPAWLYSDVPAAGLTHDGRSLSAGMAQSRTRRAFVALQVAAALTLVISTLLVTRSFARLQSVSPGFDGRNVLSVQLALPPVKYARSADISTFADKLRSALIHVDDVHDAAAISLMPLSGLLSTQDYRVGGQPEPPRDAVPQAHYRIVMPGYFRIMGIRVEGRDFDDYDREVTRRVAIISRTFAERHWPNRSPVGEHVIIGRDTLEIVAVCDDVKQFALDAGPTADVYVPLRQMPREQAQFIAARMYWVLAASRDPMQLADAVRTVVHRVDADVAASSTRPVSTIVADSIAARRFNADLMKVAGAASLLLAVIGIYSVAAFSVDRRTREIGIRLALGGKPTQVVRSILMSEARAIAVGLVTGMAGATIVSRVLSATLYASRGTEPIAILAAAAVFGVAAAAASYLPARRATRVDPIAALRVE